MFCKSVRYQKSKVLKFPRQAVSRENTDHDLSNNVVGPTLKQVFQHTDPVGRRNRQIRCFRHFKNGRIEIIYIWCVRARALVNLRV